MAFGLDMGPDSVVNSKGIGVGGGGNNVVNRMAVSYTHLPLGWVVWKPPEPRNAPRTTIRTCRYAAKGGWGWKKRWPLSAGRRLKSQNRLRTPPGCALDTMKTSRPIYWR